MGIRVEVDLEKQQWDGEIVVLPTNVHDGDNSQVGCASPYAPHDIITARKAWRREYYRKKARSYFGEPFCAL
jgi:hypothetical protein